jgi:hypothetical protein
MFKPYNNWGSILIAVKAQTLSGKTYLPLSVRQTKKIPKL